MFPKLDPKIYPIADDQQFAYELLAEQKVLIVQGTGFNWPRPDHLRVVFLPNSDDLTEAIGRIATFLEHYRTRAHALAAPHEADPGRPARRRRRRQRHLRGPAAQPGRDPAPRRARDPHQRMVADLDIARAPRRWSATRPRSSPTPARVIASPEIDVVDRADRRHRHRADAGARGDRAPASTSSPPTRRCSRCTAPRSSPRRASNGVIVAFEAAVAGGIPIIKALREGLTGEPHRVDRRDHQRHHQLHPVGDAREGHRLRRPCWPRRSAWATPRPTRPSTSTASTPRTRRRSSARSRSACRCSSTRRYVEGIAELQAADIALRRAARLPDQAARGITRRDARPARQRHRAARASDAGADAAPDRQRRRRDERGGGAGRRRRHDALLRQGRGRRADRLGGDRRPGRHRRGWPPPTRTTACRTSRSSRRRCRTSRVLPIDEVVTSFYLRLQVADEAGVLARITGILAEHDISIDALLQRPARSAGARRGAHRRDHPDPRHGRGPDDDGDRADAGAADGAGEDRRASARKSWR